MRTSKIILGLLLGCTFSQLYGQDSLRTVRSFQPGVYLDYGKILQTIDENATKWETGGEVIFSGKYQIVAEYGQWDLSPDAAIENGNYRVDGSYLRYGLGFLPYVDNESRIGIGFRYATARFSDKGAINFDPDSGLQGEVNETFARNNLTGTWYEAVFYSDRKLNKCVTLGFTIRLRFLQEYDQQNGVDVQLIPGYGNPQGNRVLAVNLFLKIPL